MPSQGEARLGVAQAIDHMRGVQCVASAEVLVPIASRHQRMPHPGHRRRRRHRVEAVVARILVAIVAGLVALEQAVAAGRAGALFGAVGVGLWVARLHPLPDHTVAADGRPAGARAGVAVVRVSVVARLLRRVDLTVAAIREQAAPRPGSPRTARACSARPKALES